MNEIDKLGRSLLRYPNVVGFAKTLQKRRRKGKIEDELCLQVHVTRKVPELELRNQDILPKSVEGVPVDVVEIGELRALSTKTDKIRPLVAGISVGNISITAGTLGWFMEKTTSPDKGEVFLGSNSHVLAEEPKNEGSNEKRILQPGSYDGGVEVAALYYWHKQLYPQGEPSPCGVANRVADTLNLMAKGLNRKTRFTTLLEEANHIDFAVAGMTVNWEKLFFDVEFPSDKFRFAGLGFAGSDIVSLVCKQQYIVEEGYRPLDYEVDTVKAGETLHKTGRTSCYTEAQVTLESAYEIVNYGAYNVAFDDVILTEKMLDPGDSGSSVWKSLLAS